MTNIDVDLIIRIILWRLALFERENDVL